MELTTDQVVALLRLVADLTEQRDAANARFQGLNREWDEYQEEQRRQRASEPNVEDIALLEVLNAWTPWGWRWHHLRAGQVAFAEVPQGEWQVEFRTGERDEAALLFVPKGRNATADVDRKVTGATRLAALVGIVARGLPSLREDDE